MREPQEICDEEHEQILERVAAVDVAKASGMVGVRVPDEERPGRRRTLVWEVSATTTAVLELGERLAGERIQNLTLEATLRLPADLVLPGGGRAGGAAGQGPPRQAGP